MGHYMSIARAARSLSPRELAADENMAPCFQAIQAAQSDAGCVDQARDWRDLEAALDDAQRCYEAGEIDADAVEAVAHCARERARHLPENADDLALSDLFRKEPMRRVYSRVLGEEVLFAADTALVPDDITLAVYRESELRALVGVPPERLRQIHQAKVGLDAEVLA